MSLLFFAVWFIVSPAMAQDAAAVDAGDAPIRTLQRADRDVLRPYLERGPALLAHFYDAHSDIASIVVAGLVDAPPATVAAVIEDASRYPRFMPAMSEVSIESTQGRQTAYRWTWQVGMFTLAGRNVMTTYPGNARRGHRIDIRAMDGDLGRGRMLWRVHSEGPDRSMVVLSIRLDMRGANYVADQLSGGGRGVYRSINTVLGTVMLLGTEREAERRAGRPATAVAGTMPLERPTLDMMALARLIGQGDLVLLERRGEDVDRVSVVSIMGAATPRVRPIMVDPELFGRSLIQGSRAEIVEQSADHTDFTWRIPMPLIGVRGRMRLYPSDSVVHVEGQEGALRDGEWFFDTHTYPWGDTAVVGWARFDVRQTARMVRSIVEEHPDVGHGVAMAAQVMVVRSLRKRIHETVSPQY